MKHSVFIKISVLVLSLLSLLLGMAGTWLLYKYAISPHIPKFSGTRLWDGGDKVKEKRDNIFYRNMSRLGIVLLLASFCIQVVNSFFQFYTQN